MRSGSNTHPPARVMHSPYNVGLFMLGNVGDVHVVSCGNSGMASGRCSIEALRMSVKAGFASWGLVTSS